MWGLRLHIEMRPGDAFLSYGSTIYHNVTGVEGQRNSVNLFCHYFTLQWGENVKRGVTGAGWDAERVRYGQDWSVSAALKKRKM